MASTVERVRIRNRCVVPNVIVANKIVPKTDQAVRPKAAAKGRVEIVNLLDAAQLTSMKPLSFPAGSFGPYPSIYNGHLDTLTHDSLLPQLIHLRHLVRRKGILHDLARQMASLVLRRRRVFTSCPVNCVLGHRVSSDGEHCSSHQLRSGGCVK